MNDHALEYLTQEVESADPARLVELLFQRALRDLENARELWGAPGRAADALIHVVHSQKVLLELQRSLNYAQGGEVARSLGRLYEYMQFRLAEAAGQTTAAEPAQLAEIHGLLAPLADAWSAMAAQQAGAQVPAGMAVAG